MKVNQVYKYIFGSISGLMIFILVMLFCVPVLGVSVKNDKYIISFNEKGALTGIYNKETGNEYYHGDGSSVLRISYLEDKTLKNLDLTCTSVTENSTGVSLIFTGGGVEADVLISSKAGDYKSTWKLNLKNSGSLRVVEAAFPVFDNIHVGDLASDDTLVRPNRYGEKIPDPENNLFKKPGDKVNGLVFKEFWNNPRLEYAGEAGMFWFDLYDKNGGFYVASEDKSLVGGYLENGVGNGIGMSLGKYIDLKQGDSISFDYAVGVHSGDWRWGADTYRTWANTFMKRAYMPRWVREMPNWYWVASIWSMGENKPKMIPAFTYDEMDKRLLNNAMGLKSNVIGLSGLEMVGHDYPYWQPDPLIGTEDQIRNINAELKRRGVKVVPYINPIYAWNEYPDVRNVDKDVTDRINSIPKDYLQPNWNYYKDFSAIRYDGTANFVETHYYGGLPQMCLGSEEWQNYPLWWTHKYALDYGFSGVQWDQLGAYPNQYCVDERHNHKYSGVGPNGTIEMCERIYSDPEYKVDKDFYIWYEGASDIFSQYMQYCHSECDVWMAFSYPELIRYTFPQNLYGSDYNFYPDLTGDAVIRAARTVELSVLGRYKLGTGTNGSHAFKVSKLAPMINAVKGLYWYTDYKGPFNLTFDQDIWADVLEITPDICPYVEKNGYMIPYVDVRKKKNGFSVKVDSKNYDLSNVEKVYWYPAFMLGERRELSFKTDKAGNMTINVPSDNGQNPFIKEQSLCKADNSISNVGIIAILKQDVDQVKLVMPQRVKRGEEFTVRTVKKDVVGNGSTAFVNVSAGRSFGMKPIDTFDGNVVSKKINGVDCYEIKSTAEPYLYFKIDDKSMLYTDHYLEVKVKYLDEGNGTFRIQYNSSDPFAMPNYFSEIFQDYKTSSIQYMGNTGMWKTAVFIIPDAYLSHKMNGDADIRIHTMENDLYVSYVSVTSKKIKETAVGNVAVSIGDAEMVTDENGVLKYTFASGDPVGAYYINAYKDDKSGILPENRVLMVE